MEEVVKLIIGVIVLLLGVPIGNYLASLTKEELKEGRLWFKSIIIISLIGGFVGLILREDVFLFSFFFIAIVTSGSLKKQKSSKK